MVGIKRKPIENHPVNGPLFGETPKKSTGHLGHSLTPPRAAVRRFCLPESHQAQAKRRLRSLRDIVSKEGQNNQTHRNEQIEQKTVKTKSTTGNRMSPGSCSWSLRTCALGVFIHKGFLCDSCLQGSSLANITLKIVGVFCNKTAFAC